MSGVRTRNSPGLSTDSSPHQKLRYSIPSRLGSMSQLFNTFLPPLRSYLVVAAAGSAPSAKDHPGVQAGQEQGLY